MKVETESNNVEITFGRRKFRIRHRVVDGIDILSFAISDGRMERSGALPDIEFSTREVMLRHIGNRLERFSE